MPELAGEERATFGVPAAAVWRYRLDFANLPAYNPDVHGVVRVADGSGVGGVAGAGARYEFSLSTPQGTHPVTLEVTAVVEDTEVSASMAGRMSATETFVVESTGPGSCRASLTLWLDVPAALPEPVRRQLLDGGRAQIRAELDAMCANLGGESPR